MDGIKISEAGSLSLSRKGTFKKQYCPNTSSHCIHCGDWCPLFGEPIRVGLYDISLDICHATFMCKTELFIDERKQLDEDGPSSPQ